jgi:outer membrane protein
MKRAIVIAATFGAVALLSAAGVRAENATAYQPEAKGTFILDLRVSDVIPDANDPIVTPAGADTGLRAKVGDSVMPTLGFTYFLTNQIAVEAIAGGTHHDVFAVAEDGTSTRVHSTWVLPPVITVQYHPFPKARVSPYVGAGVNAMVYFAGANYNGFNVKLRDEFGYAVQFGTDIALTGPWSLNLDAKKVFTDTRANIDNGTYYAKVGLDPWVVSIGLGRKF